jgi:hypothetical protein
MTVFQRFIILMAALLAVGLVGLAVWLASTALVGARQSPVESLSGTAVPLATATALPEPVEHTAPPPTSTAAPFVQPGDPSPDACLPARSTRVQARVLQAPAVNRIQVEVDGQRWEVLYLGVDLAGAQEPAQAANQALVEGQTVTLIQDAVDSDAQGMRWRYVLAGDIFVNLALIRQGMACEEVFLAAERAAQDQGVGFWAMSVPTRDPAVLTTVAVQPCPCNTTFSCADFSRREAAQACFNACGDYRNAALDEDHDGLACEDLP